MYVAAAYVEKFPRIFNSKQFQGVKRFVRSDLFENIVIGMLLVNLVAVIIETTVSQQTLSLDYSPQC